MASAADPPPASNHRYPRYRAPREDNQSLIDPPLAELAALAEANRRAIEDNSHDAHGWRISEWSTATRRRLVELATNYTRGFCDGAPPTENAPLFVSGHQPDLFHTGVWFKNRVLDRLAKQSGGVGIHLLIDSDQRRGAGVLVPHGPVGNPGWDTVAFDKATEPTPHEERAVVDADCFGSFADRVEGTLDGLVDRPLVREMWRDALSAADRGANLGEAVSQSRRLVEQRWDATTLELPLSQLCDTPELRWAFAMLIADAPRAREAYNAALADYRTAHRLRSPAQPLPDLAVNGEAVETPLWVWTGDDPTRRPLFVERTPAGYRLLDRHRGRWKIAAPSGGAIDGLVDQLAGLRASGVKVRPRALATTLFARLLLSDLFLHGVGGAKYDQVTDEWSRRWLGFLAPPHATVTATLRLPIEHPRVDSGDEKRLRVRLRELVFHPERFAASDGAEAAALIAKKRAAVAYQDGDRAERHRRIVTANRDLYRFVANERQQAVRELERVRHQMRSAAVLGSREYAFCLFSEDDLRKRFELLFR